MQQLKTRQEEYKGTELGLLPESWGVVSLDDVADLVMGQSPPGNTYNIDCNGVPFLQGKAEFGELYPKHVKYTSKPLKIAKKGTILLSVRAPVGDVNIANINYCIGRGLSSLSLKKGNNIYLFYLLVYFKPIIETEGSGSTFKAINKRALQYLKIPLPPLEEQQKIAYVLSTIQTAKEKTENMVNSLKELKKSMVNHLFTYGPVSLEDAEKVKLKKTEIGEIPEGWDVVRVDDVFEFSKKPRGLKIKDDHEISFIPMDLISDISKSAKWFIKKYSKISSGTFVFKNDLIVGKITPCFENGKQAILDNLPGEYGYATTEVWALHPKNNTIINEHLFEILKISEIRKDLAGKMEGSTGRQRLPRHVLANFNIPLPPIETQKQISSILLTIDTKIEAEENKKMALNELFKSMLKDLMTAKIRVNDMVI